MKGLVAGTFSMNISHQAFSGQRRMGTCTQTSNKFEFVGLVAGTKY